MSRDGERPGGFLSRWSQRKQQNRTAAPPEREAMPPLEPEPSAALPAAAPAGQAEGLSEEEIAALPDPDALEAGDDFKPFLRRGVPEALKRRALRRLWSVNPLFNIRDGLNDYDQDYSDAATVVANLQTLFQPGKGMPQPERWRKPEPEPEPEAEDSPLAESPEAESEEAAAAGQPDSPDDGPMLAGETKRVAETKQMDEPARRGTAAQRRWGAFAAVPEDPATAGAASAKKPPESDA